MADAIGSADKGKTGRIGLPFRVRLLIHWARLALLAERTINVFWSLAALIALFLASAWFGLFSFLPVFLHVGLLIGFAGLGLWLCGAGFRQFRWPGRNDALRRLETDSRLRHRPLSHFEDAQASNLVDPAAARLYAAHRDRLREALDALKPTIPDPRLPSADPWALRHLALLLALLGFAVAADPWGSALRLALSPSLAGEKAAREILIEAWIAPPDYTGLAPVNLDPAYKSKDPIAVPTGSRLTIEIDGAPAGGRLKIGDETSPLAQGEDGLMRSETRLTKGDSIGVQAGFATLAEWPIRILPDLPPAIAFADRPGGSDRGVLAFRYKGSDDYGIVEVKLDIRRNGETLEIALPLRRAQPGALAGQAFRDLTAHPWAGLPVEMRLIARDALGQIGSSEVAAIDLPERIFVNPVARLLIEQRKRLAADDGAPETRRSAARVLHRVKEAQDAYGGNLAAYLGMDVAARRLGAENFGPTDLKNVLDLIWDIALDIEDGGASLALRELRRLQQALADALARGADDAEISKLMNELQAAMNKYLETLRQQMQRALAEGGEFRSISPDSLNLSQQDLNRMLEEARRMAEAGDRSSAQAMLDQLQRMLENLQAGMPMMAGKEGQAQQQMMNDLARLMQRQQDLLQQSFNAERGRQSGNGSGEGSGEGMGNAPTGSGSGPNPLLQENLRHDLGQLMRRFGDALGDIPPGMGEAEQAMRDATEALTNGEFGEAANAQSQALDNLQKSLQSASEMLQRQAGLRPGEGQRNRMDPFGRPAVNNEDSPGGNTMDVFGTHVPDAASVERARQIFEELRRRRAEPDRPKPELDYLERLLKQF